MIGRSGADSQGYQRVSGTIGDRLSIGLPLLVLWLLAGATACAAAAPPRYAEIGRVGSEAGEIGIAADPNHRIGHSYATDPVTGHLYVSDNGNHRIDEFTPWGGFVKAFGWDVAPGAVNEEQEVRVRATTGTFHLIFDGATTSELTPDATASTVEAALNALSPISTGGGSVSVTGGPGGIAGTTPSVYVVHFDSGSVAATNVGQLLPGSGSPLGGGTPGTLLAVRTRADGTTGGTELEVCTTESGCKAGSVGTAAGQFGDSATESARTSPTGLGVDTAGEVYAFDIANLRVQKFDSAGKFLLAFGGGVNETTGEDVCSQPQVESGDICGAGSKGPGTGELNIENITGITGDYLDSSPGGSLFIGDKDRIQSFASNGAFLAQFDFADIHAEDASFPESGSPGALAVDPVSGDIYFSFRQASGLLEGWTPGIFRLDADGHFLQKLTEGSADGIPLAGEGPSSLAVDGSGNLFVQEAQAQGGLTKAVRIVQFGPSGEVVTSYADGFNEYPPTSWLRDGIAANSIGDVYATNFADPSVVNGYGPPPVPLEPPPLVPPDIVDQFASSVGVEESVVKARINPRFWNDTRYYVEYGSEPCSLGTCTKVPAPPGQSLTNQVVGSPVTSDGIALLNLTPGTTYHFRFVAQSTGGGPVVGEEGSFTTLKVAGAPESCPSNAAFRNGSSDQLPDCRVFEMVSPIDKGGADITVLCEKLCFPTSQNVSAGSGSALTYSSYRAFGNAISAPLASQYMARRTADGWASEGISPPQLGTALLGLVATGSNMYKFFDEELEESWLVQDRQPALQVGSEAPNLYERDNSGEYHALIGSALPAYPDVQGVTPDGRCVIFRVAGKLVPEALPDVVQLYEACRDEPLRLVSLLPNGTPSTQASTAGSAGRRTNGKDDSVFNAISQDGNRIFWSETDSSSTAGPLYLRIQSEAKTIAVSGGKGALFWGASGDGSRVYFTPSSGASVGDLQEATIDGAGKLTSKKASDGNLGVVGMSRDGKEVYFVASDDLDGSGPAQAGEPNLYLRTIGTTAVNQYIARLTSADVQAPISLVQPEPLLRTARVTPDGMYLAFMSLGQLTGYDNRDAMNGQSATEVFVYNAKEEQLVCVSCNPTGARPTGRDLRAGAHPAHLLGSAQLPPFETQLYGSRVLSDDGSRVFFDSFDALSPRDHNQNQDVYQWEKLGRGGCVEEDQAFDATSGGCIDLISSGEGNTDSTFVDASRDGGDVFFATDFSLSPQDPGLVDIYDARAGGGLPTLAPSRDECDGEACQVPVDAPAMVIPPSSDTGSGNLKPKVKKCPKGKKKVKRHGKMRCVKKAHRRHVKNPSGPVR